MCVIIQKHNHTYFNIQKVIQYIITLYKCVNEILEKNGLLRLEMSFFLLHLDSVAIK